MSHPPRALPQLAGEPNVVPMIDVLLVLLIIFMIAQTAVWRTFDLQLPQDARNATSDPSIVLSVGTGPSYEINGRPVARAALSGELRRAFAGRPTKILFVRGARTVRCQDVVSAFDAARGAGVRVTGVALEHAEPAPATVR